MRLYEFTDLKKYFLPDTDTKNLLKQVERTLLADTSDIPAPCLIEKPKIKKTKSLDTI
jgi:hypothetical protein